MLAIDCSNRQGRTMLHPASAAALRDPEWLAHRYDSNHDAFHFRRVPRDIRREVPFLTDMHLGEEAAPLVLSRTASRESVEPAPVHFLFHSAYCASTMLVQAIDQPGIASGLSEPVLLNDMVGWRRRGAAPRDHARVMDDALAMLARPLTAGEAVIIKPSNIFNPLARGALTLRPGAHAILLYAPLRVFLLSVARKALPFPPVRPANRRHGVACPAAGFRDSHSLGARPDRFTRQRGTDPRPRSGGCRGNGPLWPHR